MKCENAVIGDSKKSFNIVNFTRSIFHLVLVCLRLLLICCYYHFYQILKSKKNLNDILFTFKKNV